MLKYKINHFLSCLPMNVSIEGFAARLYEKHKISEEVFLSDRAIKVSDAEIIPQERLVIYAKEFKIHIEALYYANYTEAREKLIEQDFNGNRTKIK
jgi:hypothetical protein